MSKFVVVDKAPEKMGKGEIVIDPPSFMTEIEQNIRKAPKSGQTGINHLREILQSIANNYDQDMDVMRIRLFNYEGLPFKDNNELHTIILRILSNEYPKVLEKHLDKQIKSRPIGTKLVYYTGSFNSTSPFYQNGLDLLEQKDLESFLTGKPKKVVGKPAVTKQEAEANTNNNE